MTENLSTIHAFVSGRVQGVGYRAFTRSCALEKEVTGWAKNLADGRVEMMLSGSQQQLNHVISQLRRGPSFSQVSHLEQQTLPYQAFDGFSIG